MEIKMKKFLIALFLAFALIGCMAPKFTVKEMDTRFSENKDPLYLAENNRISTKSIAGGTHVDDTGVFLNPFVSKSRDTGEIVLLGLYVINKTFYTTTHGGVNQLGKIREVVFRFSSGELITLDATDQKNRSSDIISYNSVAQYASYDKWETGVIRISKEQLKKLASVNKVSCKIFGSKQSVVYEEKDIAPEFLENISQFYKAYVE